MLSLASRDDFDGSSATDDLPTDNGGLAALRQALVGAFARPGGSIDLSLRDLSVLLVTVQRPGQDLGGLAGQTGLPLDGVRRAVDCLRRAGLLTSQTASLGTAPALVPTPAGETVVRDMVRGMLDGARKDRPVPPRSSAGRDLRPTPR